MKVEKDKVKCTALDIEVALFDYFNPRVNVIVPNVSWGLFTHKAEVDLCILSKHSYATEIEIKVSKHDLLKDKEKRHGHYSTMIKYLYFAIPESLLPYVEHIPERAGILIVKWVDDYYSRYSPYNIIVPAKWKALKHRNPKINSKYRWNEYERGHLIRLGCMRISGLKRKLAKALNHERKAN